MTRRRRRPGAIFGAGGFGATQLVVYVASSRKPGSSAVDDIDRALIHCQRGFVQCFRQRRVRVDRALQVLGAGLEFHGERGLGDELAGHRPDDVHAEDGVGIVRRQYLHEADPCLHRAGATTGGARKQTDLESNARAPELRLGLTYPGDLGRGIDHRGDYLVVHVCVAAGDQIGDGDALFLALVRQHRTAHAVAHGPDTVGCGVALLIDLNEATLVQLYAGPWRQQVFGIRAAPDRDDNFIDAERMGPALVGVADGDVAISRDGAAHLGAKPDIQALLPEVTRGLGGELLIGNGQKVLQRLQHHDLGAEAAPDAAQLQADDAGPDHAQLVRYRAEFKRVPGVDDALVIEWRGLELDRYRAAGEHDVARLDLALGTVARRHFDPPAGQQATAAEHCRDAGRLEQRSDAAGHVAHNARPALLHHGQVERDTAGYDPVRGEFGLRAVQQLG